MNKKERVVWADGFCCAVYFVAMPVGALFAPLALIPWAIGIYPFWKIRCDIVFKHYTKALEAEGL
jgi:hypothetical protein